MVRRRTENAHQADLVLCRVVIRVLQVLEHMEMRKQLGREQQACQ